MTVEYNFKKGIDSPTWQYLAMAPSISYNGTASAYDGKRFIYWAIQSGVTTAAVGLTYLYRYDTWSNSWQYLANLVASNMGVDVEFDSIRNVVYIINGTAATWQVFNLNLVPVTIANVSCPSWVATAITPVIPAIAGAGASLSMPSDDAVPTQVDTGIAASTGNTTTVVTTTADTATFGPGMVNLQLRVTSGAQSGQKRTISAVSAPLSLTITPALPAALASTDTFVIEQVEDIATAGTTTTLTDSSANWTVNAYAFNDVIITGGTGVGQRRRIASNTATVLTLAAATTGNARTGPFATAPDATSTYKIVPSSDFLYFQPGLTNTNIYRIDVAQTTGAAWTTLAAAPAAIGGGGNSFYPAAYAPYQIVALRGNITGTAYLYNIGTNTWSTIPTFPGVETFTTGAASAMITGKRKLFVQKEATTRLYTIDLLTGVLEPFATAPYAPPVAYEGKRARIITTPDGAQFLYLLRAGGQEFFRVPIEWL